MKKFIVFVVVFLIASGILEVILTNLGIGRPVNVIINPVVGLVAGFFAAKQVVPT